MDFVNSFWRSPRKLDLSTVSVKQIKILRKLQTKNITPLCSYHVKDALIIPQDFVNRKAQKFSQVDVPKIRVHTFMTSAKND